MRGMYLSGVMSRDLPNALLRMRSCTMPGLAFERTLAEGCCALQIKEAVSFQMELQYPPPRLRPPPALPSPLEPRAQSFRPGANPFCTTRCELP